MDRYAIQELLRRLQYLEQQLEANGMATKTVQDAIRYISESNNG
jgi:hypothetical protein